MAGSRKTLETLESRKLHLWPIYSLSFPLSLSCIIIWQKTDVLMCSWLRHVHMPNVYFCIWCKLCRVFRKKRNYGDQAECLPTTDETKKFKNVYFWRCIILSICFLHIFCPLMCTVCSDRSVNTLADWKLLILTITSCQGKLWMGWSDAYILCDPNRTLIWPQNFSQIQSGFMLFKGKELSL